MLLRIGFRLVVLALVASSSALVPISLRGETVKPPEPSAPAASEPPQKSPADKDKGHIVPPSTVPEIVTDLSRLPAPVARTRERLLAAARSGDLQQLAALMTDTLPTFSFTDDKDPVAFWKANYPDSDGVDVLSILTLILDSGSIGAVERPPQ